MKNYKNLVPLLLVLLFALGMYSTVSAKQREEQEYEDCLAKARSLQKKDIVKDALEYYQKALEMYDNLPVKMEVGEMLEEKEMKEEAKDWGEELLSLYPKEPEVYSYALRQYYKEQDYEACFALNKQAESVDCINPDFKKIMDEIAYYYTVSTDGYEEVRSYSGGLAAVCSEGSWGYADEAGNLQSALKYTAAGAGNGEVQPVQEEGEGWYFADAGGNKKIDIGELKEAKEAGILIGDIFPAEYQGVWAYYDINGKKLSEEYEQALPINNGIGAVKKKGQWELIDSEFQKIGKDTYEDIKREERGIVCQQERIWVCQDDCWYMTDTSGKKIKGSEVSDAQPFSGTGKYCAVEVDGRWKFMDTSGKIVLEEEYQEARSFSNGYAAVKKDGKWGYINEKGKLVIETIFLEAGDFNSSGGAFVKLDDKWRLLRFIKNMV